jgi:predicted acylesterase/phospholipase RssA
MLVLEKLFEAKNIPLDITFQQFFDLTKKNIICTVCCLTDKIATYFQVKSHPDMKVLLAVRMSISIPCYFIPVTWNDKLYIDGVIVDPYPIHYGMQISNNTAIGVNIVDHSHNSDKITNMEEYINRILECTMDGLNILNKKYTSNTIQIMVDFKANMVTATSEEKKRLYTIGQESCQKWIENNNSQSKLEADIVAPEQDLNENENEN